MRPYSLAALTAAVALLLALGAAEILVRATGHGPARAVPPPPNEPIVHVPDPELGWRSAPGRFVLGPWAEGGEPAHMTFQEDGSRVTGPPGPSGRPVLALLGDSFTQGWAISDEETFAWKLQLRLPALEIANYGTAGYSTYQSLLVLERLFARPRPPAFVLYGYLQAHPQRNVGDPAWATALADASRHGPVTLPFCSPGSDGRLVRHPPVQAAAWPLRDRLAAVAYLEQLTGRLAARKRLARRIEVTEQLLLEMAALARRHGARFAVLGLWAAPTAHAAGFAHGGSFDWIDCSVAITPELQVPGEGHPNGILHSRWAACVAQGIAGWLPAAGPRSAPGG